MNTISDTKQTSLLAYQNMQEKIPNDHSAILEVLSFSSDLTYSEIAHRLRWLNSNKASRRLPELVRAGKIEISGTKTCSIVKSKCTTYKLKE